MMKSSTFFSFFLLYVTISMSLARTESSRLFSHAPNVHDPSSTVTDHEQSYNWPAEEDSMILAHNAIRKEIIDMKNILDALTHLESWQIESIQTWWKGHRAHMKFHCENENKYLHPAMSDRFDFPSQKMKKDHDDINKHLQKLSSIIRDLKPSCGNEEKQQQLQDLLEAWEKYMNTAIRHFREEEAESVLSTRKTFECTEWGLIIKSFFDKGAKEEFGSFIYAMGEDTFRKDFMRKRKIPGFEWALAFRKNLKYYKISMAKHMDDLQTNSIKIK